MCVLCDLTRPRVQSVAGASYSQSWPNAHTLRSTKAYRVSAVYYAPNCTKIDHIGSSAILLISGNGPDMHKLIVGLNSIVVGVPFLNYFQGL